jgi:hypothetical protein
MKSIFIFFICVISNAQIINIPDQNFKNKLLQANTNNQTAANTIIDTNANGEIEISEALMVNYLFVAVSNISDLTGIEYFTNLQYLFVNVNQITSINLSTLTNLIQFRCDRNNVSNLDLTGLINLVGVNFSHNNITEINFSLLPNINQVVCNNNLLSELDFSSNPLFTKLYCRNNNLTSLTIKNGINQDFSDLNFNDCWKTGNPNLTTICADESEVVAIQNFLNGCGTPQTINVTSTCNLNYQDFVYNDIKVFPNPSTGVFTIAFQNSIEVRKVQIFSIIGQELYVDLILNTTEKTIDVSHLSKGTYLLKVSGNNNTIEEFVVVK